MKKAIISTGGKQYIVSEGQTLDVDLIKSKDKKIEFNPLFLIDGEKVEIGKPTLSSVKVVAEVVEPEKLSEKVVSIRYKAKKRVHKVRGHRQHLTTLKVLKIA